MAINHLPLATSAGWIIGIKGMASSSAVDAIRIKEPGGDQGGGEFGYDLRDIRVVENQPFSLGWSANIKPIRAWWFDQWLAILTLMVGRKDRWVTNLQVWLTNHTSSDDSKYFFVIFTNNLK